MPNDFWVRAGINAKQPVWGFAGGIQVMLWPHGSEGGKGGPRGLLRINYPILDGGKRHGLVNYIAVEPIVGGRRGFSELEKSASDGKRGKRIAPASKGERGPDLWPGDVAGTGANETLSVPLAVERFDNGAEPLVDLIFTRSRPDEVALRLRAAPTSAPMEFCVVTATMGNYERLRLLWLQGGALHARQVWPDYDGDHFAPNKYFSLERLPRAGDGSVLVAATTDEPDPAKEPADPRAPHWHWRGTGGPVTQYWRKPPGAFRPDLRARVNARRVYWASTVPIPNGIAYENFDLMERFYDGQRFRFGLTSRTPKQLGVAR
jgi:hypothetical protein